MVFVIQQCWVCSPEQVANGACPKGAGTEPDPSDALIDLKADGGASPGHVVKMPEHPFEWQKKPPCDNDASEEAVNGACYLATKRRPPCGPKLMQHGDTCYRAIAKAPREPTSIEH